MTRQGADSWVREQAIPEEGLVRSEGEYWTVEYGGMVCRIRDSKGVRYLSTLLSRPGERLAACELEGEADESPAAVERARLNVTRAIRATRAKIALLHPPLGDHLEATVRTGKYCTYRPDPRVPIRWRV